ncbi:MAG: response regulator [Bryobacteraceae bacterium]
MARVLLIDDDADQLEIRGLLAERAGHSVASALDAASARECFTRFQPEVVVMDLRIPKSEDGLALIREFRAARPLTRLMILSGFTADFTGRPEAALVDEVLAKPVRSARLLELVAKLVVCLVCLLPQLRAADAVTFRVTAAAEMLADLDLSSPGSNWSQEGREAALADVSLDGRIIQNVMVSTGAETHTYPVFLGKVPAGEHSLAIAKNTGYSAPQSGLSVHGARFREVRPADPDYIAVANAPVLFARRNTVGKFTDIPLIVYAERLTENGQSILQYTVIFSNEDGGTSTRALMARWGRTTDVEYVYRAWLGGNGQVERAAIQADGHKEIEFRGQRDGAHPMLIPSTDNNMVSDGGPSAIRYQIAPVMVDLTGHSREEVIDRHPFAYRIMAEELPRENKLRPFGTVDDHKISDPRNYLYLEAKVQNAGSGFAALVRLKGDARWRSSNLGREDYAIERSGWVRTTVELPPGTKAADIAGLGFACIVVRPGRGPLPIAGTCQLDAVGKAFFLDRDYKPEPSLWSLQPQSPVAIPSGQIATFPLSGARN